jgi:hypothetical protein
MVESTRRRSSARQRRYLEFHADSEMHRRALPCGHEVNQLSVLFGIQAVMETVRQAGQLNYQHELHGGNHRSTHLHCLCCGQVGRYRHDQGSSNRPQPLRDQSQFSASRTR